MEPPADGWLYHLVHRSFNFIPRRGLTAFASLLFVAENFYVNKIRPLLGLRPSEKYFAYRWILNLLGKGRGRVLDVGIGDSLLFSQLLRQGWEVWAIDLADSPVARHPQLRFIRGDLCYAPFTERVFDWIIAVSTLEHIGEESQARLVVRELNRLLRESGGMLVTLPLCGAVAERGLRMRELLAREFSIAREEYAIAQQGQRGWNRISREETAKVDPKREIIVVHLALKKA